MNPYAPPRPPAPTSPTSPTSPDKHAAVWANARKRGVALIGCGLLCGAIDVLTIRAMHSFYALVVVLAPAATLLGITLVAIGNRQPPIPAWVGKAVLASFGAGALLGVAAVLYLRG